MFHVRGASLSSSIEWLSEEEVGYRGSFEDLISKLAPMALLIYKDTGVSPTNHQCSVSSVIRFVFSPIHPKANILTMCNNKLA